MSKNFLESLYKLLSGDDKLSDTVLWAKWVGDFDQSEIYFPDSEKELFDENLLYTCTFLCHKLWNWPSQQQNMVIKEQTTCYNAAFE